MSICKLKSAPEKTTVTHTRIVEDANLAESYQIGKLLGQGSFGKVYEAVHKQTGKTCAVKSINKEKAGSAAMKLVEREVAILKKVNHEHIIQLYEVVESPRKMYLVMEICRGGELADVLKTSKCLNELIVQQIMSNLASAISYLHKNDIVHRDLKLENILIYNDLDDDDHQWNIKVTDFGLSIVKGGQGQDNMMQAFCGTPIYMAPEILDNKAYSRQCDIWALGVLMYILLCGRAPFNASEDDKLYELIKQAKVDFSGDVWNSISEEAKSCVLSMLTLDPAHRLTAVEICQHQFITGKPKSKETTNVLQMMKQYNNEMRNGNESQNVILSNSDDDTHPKILVIQPSSSPKYCDSLIQDKSKTFASKQSRPSTSDKSTRSLSEKSISEKSAPDKSRDKVDSAERKTNSPKPDRQTSSHYSTSKLSHKSVTSQGRHKASSMTSSVPLRSLKKK